MVNTRNRPSVHMSGLAVANTAGLASGEEEGEGRGEGGDTVMVIGPST